MTSHLSPLHHHPWKNSLSHWTKVPRSLWLRFIYTSAVCPASHGCFNRKFIAVRRSCFIRTSKQSSPPVVPAHIGITQFTVSQKLSHVLSFLVCLLFISGITEWQTHCWGNFESISRQTTNDFTLEVKIQQNVREKKKQKTSIFQKLESR